MAPPAASVSSLSGTRLRLANNYLIHTENDDDEEDSNKIKKITGHTGEVMKYIPPPISLAFDMGGFDFFAAPRQIT